MTTDAILVLNAGSSSLKFSLYDADAAGELVALSKGQIEGLGTRPRLIMRNPQGQQLAEEAYDPSEVAGHPEALERLAAQLRAQHAGLRPVAVGHRVVHGGPLFVAPVLVTDDVVQELETLVPLAPLH